MQQYVNQSIYLSILTVFPPQLDKFGFECIRKNITSIFAVDFVKIWKISKLKVENIVVMVKKTRLLIMSNFSLCHNVYKSRLLQRRHKVSIWGMYMFNPLRLYVFSTALCDWNCFCFHLRRRLACMFIIVSPSIHKKWFVCR